jgi:hypothetical protein
MSLRGDEMTEQEIDDLEKLGQAASNGPWHIAHISDSIGMSTVSVTKNPSAGREIDAFPEWVAEDVVAACLLQSESHVAVDDGRWHENARLIAAMRNALPELLRLARLGMASEQ